MLKIMESYDKKQTKSADIKSLVDTDKHKNRID